MFLPVYQHQTDTQSTLHGNGSKRKVEVNAWLVPVQAF